MEVCGVTKLECAMCQPCCEHRIEDNKNINDQYNNLINNNYIKITINPDKEHVKKIIKALKDNNGYCPCAIIKSEDTKCMCKDFRDMIKNNETGDCHCDLYHIARSV